MFTDYFAKQSAGLLLSLDKNLEKKGVQAPGKEKDLNLYKEFYTFLKEHLPDHFSLATGKVRNRKHILNKNCDLLIYHKWFPNFLEMAGGYVLSDFLYAVLTMETELQPQAIVTHAGMTNALKSLYQADRNIDDREIIKMYSILFAYRTTLSLDEVREILYEAISSKEIVSNHEVDLISILGKGILIKDWEHEGSYKIIETGADTLMWFYVLLLEYLDRDGKIGQDARAYIKKSEEYREY